MDSFECTPHAATCEFPYADTMDSCINEVANGIERRREVNEKKKEELLLKMKENNLTIICSFDGGIDEYWGKTWERRSRKRKIEDIMNDCPEQIEIKSTGEKFSVKSI